MKLVVADDSALLREGLVGLLERQGHEVIGQAATAPELETCVHDLVAAGDTPDVVLTDVRMPPTMGDDGLAAAVRLRAAHPGIGILVVSQYVAPAYADLLFGAQPRGEEAGVGYLLKDRVSRVADFMSSLQIVAAGGVVVDPEVAAQLVRRRSSSLDALTPRELEVLELMARGLSNAQIGDTLFLSPGSVSKHVANVFTKLDLPPGEDNRRVRAVLAYMSATT
ncbi:MAG: response regulator transcription factor [Mobilicoccus sp.]|nr:response regulator transcription factor [Mobilicoccus sp.]